MMVLALALTAACGDDDGGFDGGLGDTGPRDTSVPLDTASPDVGGGVDAGVDAATFDSGADAGVDSATPDAGATPDGGGSDGFVLPDVGGIPDVGIGATCSSSDECPEGEECCMIGGFGLCMASCPF